MALIRLPFLVLSLCLLAACTGQELRPVEHNAAQFASWSDEVPAYRYGYGDVLQIRFLFTPEMDEETIVGPDGYITLRAAGRVQALDRTEQELKQRIEEDSRRILRNPEVTVITKEAASWRVYVGGSVRNPGTFRIAGPTGLLEAVTMAGGFDPQARFGEVVLIRRNKNDRPMLRTVDLQAFLDTGSTAGDVPLYAGDIVYVPRSRIAEVNLWIDQFIEQVVPFQRTFNYTIYSNTAPVW